MHRSAYFQRLLILGLSGPLLARIISLFSASDYGASNFGNSRLSAKLPCPDHRAVLPESVSGSDCCFAFHPGALGHSRDHQERQL